MGAKDLTTYLGLAAVYLLSFNVLLGLLMGARYNTWKRWPHRRINILKLHNWTAYVGLALSVLHPVPLLFLDKPHFRLFDVLWPIQSPEQPTINSRAAASMPRLWLASQPGSETRRVIRSVAGSTSASSSRVSTPTSTR